MQESITQHLSLTQAVRLVKGYQSTSKGSSHDRISASLKEQLFQHFYQHCSIATMSALLHSTSQHHSLQDLLFLSDHRFTPSLLPLSISLSYIILSTPIFFCYSPPPVLLSPAAPIDRNTSLFDLTSMWEYSLSSASSCRIEPLRRCPAG